MSAVIDCLKEVVNTLKSSNTIQSNKLNDDLMDFIEKAKPETERIKLYLNGRILILYSIYHVLKKIKIPDDKILTLTLQLYNSAFKSGTIDKYKEKSNVRFNDKVSTDDVKNLFSNNINYILNNIESVCGTGSRHVFANIVPHVIQNTYAIPFSRNIKNESFKKNEVIGYLNTSFINITSEDYINFNSLNTYIKTDPSLLITSNYTKDINNDFEKTIDTNSRKLFEFLNDIHYKYKLNDFQVPEDVVNGNAFYNNGVDINLQEVVKKPTS